MNKTTTMFSIAVLAAVMIGGSLSPAMAAGKVTFNETIITDEIISDTPCGNFDTQITGTTTFDTTLWDNGHVLTIINQHLDFHDLSGSLVGQINFVQVYNEATGGLPLTVSQQGTLTCVGTGLVDEIHFGFTIDENGVAHIHNLI